MVYPPRRITPSSRPPYARSPQSHPHTRAHRPGRRRRDARRLPPHRLPPRSQPDHPAAGAGARRARSGAAAAGRRGDGGAEWNGGRGRRWGAAGGGRARLKAPRRIRIRSEKKWKKNSAQYAYARVSGGAVRLPWPHVLRVSTAPVPGGLYAGTVGAGRQYIAGPRGVASEASTLRVLGGRGASTLRVWGPGSPPVARAPGLGRTRGLPSPRDSPWVTGAPADCPLPAAADRWPPRLRTQLFRDISPPGCPWPGPRHTLTRGGRTRPRSSFIRHLCPVWVQGCNTLLSLFLASQAAWPALCRYSVLRWAGWNVPSWKAPGVCLAKLHCVVGRHFSQMRLRLASMAAT